MTIDFKIPDSWAKLTQKQLRSVYKYFASERFTMHQCKLLLALKFAGASYMGMSDAGPVVRIDKQNLYLTDDQLLAIAHEMDFLDGYPNFPVRIYQMNHRYAVHPLMRDINFAQWLAIENFYAGFLTTKDISLLNEILCILYPAKGGIGRFLKPFKNVKGIDYRHINAIYWICAFKTWLTKRYSELFRIPSENDIQLCDNNSPLKVMESMEAQIRALTKGDITKKEQVLQMDLHSALTELNALALESRKFNESLKKQK